MPRTPAQYFFCDGRMLRRLIIASEAWLNHHREHVNSMNVFPVPDGDTGTNMLLTIQRAVEEIRDADTANIALISERAAQGALLGARGNSGTILSMLLRGFAIGLSGHSRMNASLLIQASQNAVEYAYATVSKVMTPVEGTILTVAREAVAGLPQGERDLRLVLHHIIQGARASLQRTPDLLPVLKQANVIDSGGLGLLLLLEGMHRFIHDEPLPETTSSPTSATPIPSLAEVLAPDSDEGYGYDVQFLMRGDDLDVDQITRDIAAMGWSPLVDGTPQLIKVHIHVHDAGAPLTYAIQQGATLDDIVVENMQSQFITYLQTRQQAEQARHDDTTSIAVIAVANGDGLRQIFTAYGARALITGGQTMNPSTDDFLQQIQAMPVDEIIILPNNRNIVMAAQQAAQLTSGKDVRVVPTHTIPQGISALLAYGDTLETTNLDEIIQAMQASRNLVISAEITFATRTSQVNDISIQKGDFIGIFEGNIVVATLDIRHALTHIIQLATAQEADHATFYHGADCTDEMLTILQELVQVFADDLIFEIIDGGQPLYPFIISFE